MGSKIQGLAIITGLVAVCAGIVSGALIVKTSTMLGIGLILGISVSAIVSAYLLYAFGHLVETCDTLSEQVRQLKQGLLVMNGAESGIAVENTEESERLEKLKKILEENSEEEDEQPLAPIEVEDGDWVCPECAREHTASESKCKCGYRKV